jgi:hypothetical protein
VLRRRLACCLLAAVVGLAGCKNCETNPDPASGHGNSPGTTDGVGAVKKSPPNNDSADGLWMNSDRAKKISHDLDQTTD